MMTPIKWVFTSVLLIVLVLSTAYASSIQNINTNTTSEIEVLADTINAGLIREEIDNHGKVDGQFFNKDELIANLTSKVVAVQKKHPYDIVLDYVFFDKNGNVTTVDKDIRSIQFRLRFINDKGKVKGMAERHLAVSQLNE